MYLYMYIHIDTYSQSYMNTRTHRQITISLYRSNIMAV